MKKNLLKISIVFLGVLPYIVRAQTYIGSQTSNTNWSSIKDIFEAIGTFITGTIMPIVVSLGFLYFIWNTAQYILSFDNEKERESFKKYSVNAIIALFIMMSLWGIIGIATGTFFGTQPVVPQFKTNPNGSVTAP